jgi:hypothetical protein
VEPVSTVFPAIPLGNFSLGGDFGAEFAKLPSRPFLLVGSVVPSQAITTPVGGDGVPAAAMFPSWNLRIVSRKTLGLVA